MLQAAFSQRLLGGGGWELWLVHGQRRYQAWCSQSLGILKKDKNHARAVVGVGLVQRMRLSSGVQWEGWVLEMEKSQHLFP